MDSITRVFFHELGHYVAQELNRIYYGGTGVHEMSIFPCATDNSELCGGTLPKLPDGVDRTEHRPPPIERLAQLLASLVHGCMFQCYFDGTKFGDCLITFGDGDINDRLGALSSHGISFAHKYFYNLDVLYFQNLVSNSLLSDFGKLNPQDYFLSQNQDKILIDLDRLQKEIGPVIAAYYPTYKGLIDSYNAIISRYIKLK